MISDTVAALEGQWENLTIANDFVFCKAMLDEELCRDVLEAILDIPIDHIEYIGRQEVLDTSPSAKTVRLDVYGRDERGTVFNVEMQAVDTGELPRRTRFYHAMMDIDQLERGQKYRDLKDSYVIFICTFDPFGLGRRVYWFENACRDEPSLALCDGNATVFLSSSAPCDSRGSRRLNELLNYVADGSVGGGLSERLERAVNRVLDNEKWRLEYMLLQVRDQLNVDLGYAKGRKDGFTEGLTHGREDGLAEGMARGREDAERRLTALVSALLDSGRSEDAARAMADTSYRDTVLAELGIH